MHIDIVCIDFTNLRRLHRLLLMSLTILTNRYSRLVLSTVAHRSHNALFATPITWGAIARQLWVCFRGSPRLPFLLPVRATKKDAIYFQGERAQS